MFSKDNDEEHIMHWKSDNIETKINDKADKTLEELIHQSVFSRYQVRMKTSIGGNNFTFDYVLLLFYKFHKISFKGGRFSKLDRKLKSKNNAFDML